MIVRFIDRKGRCCQVATPETPILVYMTEDEKAKLQSGSGGQCLMLIDNRLGEEKIQKTAELLNTKLDPLQIK